MTSPIILTTTGSQGIADVVAELERAFGHRDGFQSGPMPVKNATLQGIIVAHVLHLDVPIRGVLMIPPNSMEVEAIAAELTAGAAEYRVPVDFLAAAMCAESRFSLACRNGHYLDTNPTQTPEGTDWGPGQVPGATVVALPGMAALTWPQRAEKLADPHYSVPLFCATYAELLTAADALVKGSEVPQSLNRYALAAGAYERLGLPDPGAAASGTFARAVACFCNHFSDALGHPRIMPEV
jgi:hypothetical protein